MACPTSKYTFRPALTDDPVTCSRCRVTKSPHDYYWGAKAPSMPCKDCRKRVVALGLPLIKRIKGPVNIRVAYERARRREKVRALLGEGGKHEQAD